MFFPFPLTRGTLVRRYKRFLCDVILESGEEITAHIANSGAMTGLAAPGLEVWLSPAANPARKLAWTWELVRIDGRLVGVNTAYPNAIVAEAVAAGAIPELTGYHSARREVRYGKNSRIDLLLEDISRPTCYVEVKSVTLQCGTSACFPDAVTARGTKHLDELSMMVAVGNRAVMLFLVQRSDCDLFRPATDIDPIYSRTLGQAAAAGVELLCYSCRLSLEGIAVDRPLPLALPDGPQ